ncbi:MAG: hypothetical protein K6E84_03220 [Lachnospiraceae bacterium]|nr:hypothetical protein [Lachnospiraceae bacterium]
MRKIKTGSLKAAGVILLAALLMTGCGTKMPAEDTGEAQEETAESDGTSQEETPAADENAAEDDAQTEDQEEVKEPEAPGPEEGELSEEQLFFRLSDWSFHFCSGAGAWETALTIEPDGTFSGEYYDANMGETGEGYDNGTMYQCVFQGKLKKEKMITPFSYELKIDEITCERKANEEEIIDGMKFIYTGPYGLLNANSLRLYLPGMPVEDLSQDYMDWITPMFFGCYLEDDYYQVLPEELPFYGLFNPDEGNGFYSQYDGKKNVNYFSARGTFPGLKNEKSEMNEDGTYRIEDADEGYTAYLVNTCFPLEEGDAGMYDDSEKFTEQCIEKVFSQKPKDLYVLDRSSYMFDRAGMIYTEGTPCIYAGWTIGSNEDTRSCTAKLTQIGNYAYMFVFNMSEYDTLVDSEAIGFILETLQLKGRPDHLSMAADEPIGESELHKFYANVKAGEGDSLMADEVIWLGPADEEEMKQYGIDPAELTNDYAIVEADGRYKAYTLPEDTSCFVQYPEEGMFYKYKNAKDFRKWLKENSERLLVLYADKNDVLRFVYEPYTP